MSKFFKSLKSGVAGDVVAVLYRKSKEEIGGPDCPHVVFSLMMPDGECVCESREFFDSVADAESYFDGISDDSIDSLLSSFFDFHSKVKSERV